jgi:hypothetical protein
MKLVAEAQGQFRSPEEGEILSLEAVTRKLVKTQQAEKTYVCAVVNFRVN